MLEQNKTEARLARHKISQEDFTPECIVKLLFENSEESFKDFSKTVLDPCAGICYILMYCLKQRLTYCKSEKDIIAAISTLYGTELFEDNCIEGRQNLLDVILEYARDTEYIVSNKTINKIKNILENNIVCTDTFKWDYDKWKPKEELKIQPLF